MLSQDGFDEVVALATVQSDQRVILAYDWNGQPLPTAHGFPLRVYIPDLYGMKQPKWITDIVLVPDFIPGYWVKRGWDKQAIRRTTSVIDTVATSDLQKRAGRTYVPVGGIADAGSRGISKVEIQVDGGPWEPAELRQPLSPLTWVIWRYEWPWQQGEHIFGVRAYDGAGVLQTTTAQPDVPLRRDGHRHHAGQHPAAVSAAHAPQGPLAPAQPGAAGAGRHSRPQRRGRPAAEASSAPTCRANDLHAHVGYTMAAVAGLHALLHLGVMRSSRAAGAAAITRDELRPGDLVFGAASRHVGVYAGGGDVDHRCPGPGSVVGSVRPWADWGADLCVPPLRREHRLPRGAAWQGATSACPTCGAARARSGFDASGLTMYVYAQLGAALDARRDWHQQHSATPIPLSKLRRGDLVFFGSARYSHHVGIYIGNGPHDRRAAHRLRRASRPGLVHGGRLDRREAPADALSARRTARPKVGDGTGRAAGRATRRRLRRRPVPLRDRRARSSAAGEPVQLRLELVDLGLDLRLLVRQARRLGGDLGRQLRRRRTAPSGCP